MVAFKSKVSKIIIKLLEDENKSIFELANYLRIPPKTLNSKLKKNQFTLDQLEIISDFFDCELLISFKPIDENNQNTYTAETRIKQIHDFYHNSNVGYEALIELHNTRNQDK